MAALEKCRSCHKPVRFVETLKGKLVPIDPDPADNGTIYLGNDGRARYLQTKVAQCRACGCTEKDACSTGLLDLAEQPIGCSWIEPDLCSMCQGKPSLRYVSHFATCPQAAQWRKPGSAAAAVERVRQATRDSIERGSTGIRDALEGGPEAAMERRRPR